MRWLNPRVMALMLVAACGPGVYAQDLLGVYDLAVHNDAQLAAAQGVLAAAQEAKPQARSFLLPQIEAIALTSYNTLRTNNSESFFGNGTSRFNSNSVTLQAVQPLFNWAVFAGVGQADALVRQAHNQYSFAETELMLRTASRYFAVLSALDNLDFANAEKSAISRQLEQARQRFDVGLIAITDIHEAQARFDLTTAQEIAARNRVQAALEGLREVTGDLPAQLSPLDADVKLAMPDPQDIEQWVQTALGANPLVAAAAEAQRAAAKDIARQRAAHYPTLDATAQYRESSDNGSRFGGGFDAEDTIYGLQMRMPIFSGGLVSSRVRESQAHYREASARLDAQQRAAARQTREAYLGVQAAISRVTALRQAVVSNQSALEATELGYQVGTRTSVDVLDAQRELYRAKSDLSTARYDYVLNLLALRQSAGTLGTADLTEVNRWLTVQPRDVSVPVEMPADAAPAPQPSAPAPDTPPG